jgi:hypothetical protein
LKKKKGREWGGLEKEGEMNQKEMSVLCFYL